MSNRSISLILLLCLFCPCYVIAQESVLQSYQQNFSRVDLSAKPGILLDAAANAGANESIGELYEFALQFVLQNVEILGKDPDMQKLAGIAARGAGVSGNRQSLETLEKLFAAYRDSLARVDILMAIGRLGRGDSAVIESLNNFLLSENRFYSFGMGADYSVISACIAVIAEQGDSSSYPALFSVLTTGYPEVIVLEASGALDMISGDYRQFLVDVIQKNHPGEKLAAFRAGINSGRFRPAEKGQLAEIALEQGLISVSGDDNIVLSALRYSAILALTQLQWTRASPLVVRHFYRVQTDFQQGIADKGRFLEAIACLGAIGSSDAALALALQLGLTNARTERIGEFDEDIALALVQALGRIGDKAAFDYLYYISYLSYPDHIQAAAKEALGRLKW